MAKGRKRKPISGKEAKLRKLVDQYSRAKADWRAKERASHRAAIRATRLRGQILKTLGKPYRITAQAVRYARTPQGKFVLEAYGLKSVKPLGAQKRGSQPPNVAPWKGPLPFSVGPVFDPLNACALYVDIVEEPIETEGTFDWDNDPLPSNMRAECYNVGCKSGCRVRHQGNADGGTIWCECPDEPYPVG